MQDITHIGQFEVELLQEVGNIGVGHAATSMSQMLSSKVLIGLPKVSFIPLNALFDLVGSPEEWVSCVSVRFEGEAPCYFLLLFEQQTALDVVDLMMERNLGSTKTLDEMGESVLQEVGNILSGGFATALNTLTGLSFAATVPAFSSDMFGAVFSSLIVASGQVEDTILVFESQMSNQQYKILGRFFLLPEPGSLDIISKRLRLE